jgi:hypothetical protein
MLYPSRFWKNLFVLFLIQTYYPTVMVKDDKPGAGRPLIHSAHVSIHYFPPKLYWSAKKWAGLNGRPGLAVL